MLDQAIPPIEPPKDTKYIKHIKIQSKLLTEFWGRPMHLGACVLLPHGFEEHPKARYPLAIFHGHFPATIGGFRETPADPKLKPDYNKRFKLHGYNKIEQEYAHQLYKDWTGPGFPRMVMIEIQHANPYYDDSYAVNSANLGPYGDAITYRADPRGRKAISLHRRGLGPLSFTAARPAGGSRWPCRSFIPTNTTAAGWRAPIRSISARTRSSISTSTRTPTIVDSQFAKTPRPGLRNYLGEVGITLEDMNRRELVLGTNSPLGRSVGHLAGRLFARGDDGYPKPIWDKVTGQIDHSVAEYWREHYDLGHILKRDWPKIGKKLQGKIHIYCGDMDNYYLNNAVYLVEEYSEDHEGPALRRRSLLRRPRRTLLERRPHAAERVFPPPLPPDARAEDPGADSQIGSAGSGSHELAVLIRSPTTTAVEVRGGDAECSAAIESASICARLHDGSNRPNRRALASAGQQGR